jgi:hypothetical protein
MAPLRSLHRLVLHRLAGPAAGLFLFAVPSAAQTFTVVGLPDTQNYSEFFPTVFSAQTQWVADNLEALDVRYVSHYGDVVNNGDQLDEWSNGDFAMSILDATGVPQGVTAGNHDITPTGFAGEPYIPTFFASYFGPQRYAGRDWYRGASPSAMSSYQVFTAGAVEFLTLHVECDAALRELEWAQGVLDRHRDKPVLMTTHRYLQDAEDYTAGVPIVPSGRYPEIWYTIEDTYTPDGIRSEDLWDWFVRRNPNIFMVMCGHFHEEYRQTSTNAAGLPVHEVLADYQDDPNGGDGWLRLYTFDLANDHIDVDTYSPTLDQWRTADESDFSLAVDFDAYYEWSPTVVLQQGINGYQGTQDTWVNEDAPNTSYGDNDTRVSDDDTANGFFSDDRGQALIRFDGLIGDAGAGRVPAGATIESAWLTIQVVDDVDFLFDPDFFVHRVLVPWDEGSTWNSLGGGLSSGELSAVVAAFDGDNGANGDGLRRIDVTAAVQAWASGEPNHGFAILPEIITGNDDGIEIATSESGNPLLRPRIEVTYAYDCGYQPYGVGFGGANVLELSGVGLPRLGDRLQVTTTGGAATAVIDALAFQSASVPFAGGTLLLDVGSLYTVAVTPAPGGVSTWTLDLPADPGLAGASVFLQTFTFDATRIEGLALSNGLEATICP